MRSTRPLRPAHSTRRHTLESAGIAVGAVIGIFALTGVAAMSASAYSESPDSGSIMGTSMPAATALAQSVRHISDEADMRLDAARNALSGAQTVTADIAASGLDLGVETTHDTAALRERIERLSATDTLPLLFLPGMSDDAAAETKRVAARTAELREALDAAVAKKAAEEAAAAAAAEAKRQAEAAAAAAEAAAAAAAEAAARVNTPDGAKATARQIAAAEYGWGDGQFSCLESLWTRESGWNYQAYNSGSGATGIPQSLPGSKMASAGADWQTNATTQIRWGLGYIAGSYGSPCSAWGHSQATGWY
jgi:hypothetical protein